MKHRAPFVYLASALMTLSPAAHAKSPSAPAAGTPVLPPATAKSWTLSNGLALIVQEDHSAPVASVQAWCKTGSIDEDTRLGSGMSHILEHMLFKGTEKRSTNDIALRVQEQGGYINAYTSYDRTVYWIDIPAKGVETAVDILSDVMMNATMPEAEYVKEQEVIRREFAMNYDDPDRMAFLDMMDTAFRSHPYRYPVIGHMEVYNTLTRDDVMAYYKKRYVPNNIFFVITGDVDGEKLKAQLETFFAKYPRKALEPVFIPQEAPQLGRRELNKEFPTELTRLQLCWHTPDLTHPDVPALDLLSVILGNGRSSRFYLQLREKQNLAHAISAYNYTPRDPGIFGVEATCDPDKRDSLAAAILAQIEEVKSKPVSADELAKAKKMFISSHLANLTTTRGVAGDLGSNWMLTGNLDFSRQYLEASNKVTAADLQRVAKLYFREDGLTVTSMNPEGSLKADAKAAAVPAAAPVQKFVLSNGLRLLVREDTRLPLVSAVASFKGGLLAETEALNGISQLAARAVLKGTKTRSAEQISTTLENLGGSISAEAGNQSFTVSVDTMKDDLPRGLEVLSDVLLNATYPEAAIAREKLGQLAAIKAQEEEMTNVARNLMRRTMFPGHPLGMRALGTPETVDTFTQAQLLDYHRATICGSNGVLAVFGDVKAEEVKKLVETQLAKLAKGTETLLTVPPTPVLAEALTVEENKPKAQAILMVAYRGVDIFDKDRTAFELIEEASSDLSSRFFVKIREELGLAYFVGASQAPSLVPGPFVFYLGTDPKKLEQVKTAFNAEIKNLADNGLTPEELARAKEKLLGQSQIRNQSSDALASVCALDELYGLGFDNYLKEAAQVEAVTVEDTKRIAHEYFATKPAVTAIVTPKK